MRACVPIQLVAESMGKQPLWAHLHSTSVKLVQLHACKGKQIKRHITNWHDLAMQQGELAVQSLCINQEVYELSVLCPGL